MQVRIRVPKWNVPRQNEIIAARECNGWCLVEVRDLPHGPRELWFRPMGPIVNGVVQVKHPDSN